MKRFVFIIFTIVFLSGCAAPKLAPVDDDLLANDDEQMIWRQSLEEQSALNTSGVLLGDMALQTYLNQIVRKLQPDDLPAKMSFKVLVVRDPYLNAYAFPSGTIYLHTGLLARMDNEAQLAALLAHEMAHCTQRHALQAFRCIKARSGFVASILQTLARLVMIQDTTGFNRDFETQADVVGLDYLVSADYDPYEALRLFEHLKAEIELEQIKEPYFFGTHPKVQARIDTIRRLLETTYADKHGGINNREIFLSTVNPVILENARLDLKSGRFWLAQRGVEKYLQRAENDAGAHYLMGEIFRQRGREGDSEKALSYYRRATLKDPSYSEPHKAIGLIHYKGGQKALAKEFFESCLQLAPDSPDKAYIQGYIKQCTEDGEG
jgi:tetratricopeptide (TPR) repeat protein